MLLTEFIEQLIEKEPDLVSKQSDIHLNIDEM